MSIGYTAGMPAPARTSREAIIQAARELLEAEGLDAVTMASIGERVGVRGPSLYKRVRDRSELIRLVGEDVVADLAGVIAKAASRGTPEAALRSVAHAYRTFVHANPNGYALLFARLGPDLEPDPAHLGEVAVPIVAATGRLVGDEEALSSARTFVAWAHGFLSLEMVGGFRLGGDLDEAYASGIETIVGAMTAGGVRASGSRRRT
jgi:AcrR family transcriptional regulator